MSKFKVRPNSEICGDCGSTEATWASINRGILLCVQCCNTHRSLGRHISIVKSLKSQWPPSLLNMLKTLNASGANNIWEYALEKDSKLAKKKPTPSDSLEDKAKFIKSKHQDNEFLQRPHWEDGQLCIENELGKQLHASVRSGNLLTSFKLLIQGADPNYFHDEKGSTPLHAAIKADQILQVELLLIYGADPTHPDSAGKTPVDYARVCINNSLLKRLVEAQYEVTDKFHQYLFLKKPDHSLGIHFFAPHPSQFNSIAYEKLKKLPNDLFEELVKDVYDEVERRETEAIWLGSSDSIELCAVPFLPVDPLLSTTRNQSRQKLGRFASPELKSLVNAILLDAQRRQNLCLRDTQITDEDPLYDSVASDDDYATIPSDEPSATAKDASDSGKKSNLELEALRKQLQESNSKVNDLKAEVGNLKGLVEHLSSANYDLRMKLNQLSNQQNGNQGFSNRESGYQSLDQCLLTKKQELTEQVLTNGSRNENNNCDAVENKLASLKKMQRPTSMYETREGLRTMNWQAMKNQVKSNDIGSKNKLPTETALMVCAEQVTKGISDLWKCTQSQNRSNCVSYADTLRDSVINLTKVVPADSGCIDVIKHLLNSTSHLQTNCIGLQTSSKVNEPEVADKYMQNIRMWAYEIAKETKFLLTKYNISK